MELLSKSVLNVLTCTGGCFAVGVPVAMHSIGGGDARPVILTHCEDEGREGVRAVNFGEKGTRRVCWYLTSGSQSITNKDAFTELFSNNGKKASESELEWTFYDQDKWKQQCESVKNKGGTSSSELNTERLGLCEKDEYKDTPFVKKQKSSVENNSTLKFGICDRECGDSASSSDVGGSTMLQKENSGNGKEVKFRKK